MKQNGYVLVKGEKIRKKFTEFVLNLYGNERFTTSSRSGIRKSNRGFESSFKGDFDESHSY